MALHEIRTGTEAMSPVEMNMSRGRRSSGVNWGAIFVGSFVALAFSVMFSLLATAVYIGGINLILPTPDITVGEAIYGILMVGVSLAIAGYVTARIGRFEDSRTAILHGLGAWAIGAPLIVLAAALLTNLFVFATGGLIWSMFLAYAAGCVFSMVGAAAGAKRSSRAYLRQDQPVPVERRAA